jgi:hypothetical protein
VSYYGLQVDDSAGYYSSGRVRIDIHKKEATNGCIFILDPDTPSLDEGRGVVSAFEPKLIKDVQHAIGAKTRWSFGMMRMIDVQ